MPNATPDVFSLDHYVLRRKVLKLFGASFHAFDDRGDIVAFIEQKAFKLKEDIRIRASEHGAELLAIRARQIVDFSAAYDVIDAPSGRKIGALRRRGMRSMLRDSWDTLDEHNAVLATLVEDSLLMATVRRFVGHLIPQRFRLGTGGPADVMMRQHFNPFVYRLDVHVPRECPLDRRLVFAQALLIAAVEGRQE